MNRYRYPNQIIYIFINPHPPLNRILFSIFPLTYYTNSQIDPFPEVCSQCYAVYRPKGLFIYDRLYIALDDLSNNLSGSVHDNEYKDINFLDPIESQVDYFVTRSLVFGDSRQSLNEVRTKNIFLVDFSKEDTNLIALKIKKALHGSFQICYLCRLDSYNLLQIVT